MNNKINIAELLKDAPSGTKVWCDAYGYCTVIKVSDNGINIVASAPKKAIANFWVDAYGRYKHDLYPDGVCIIFPSKDCRTWENFRAPWKHKVFSSFSKVLVSEERIWMPASYSYYNEKLKRHVMTNGLSYSDNDILPYECNERLVGKETSETTDD